MKSAQDYLNQYVGGHVRGGFNARLYGESRMKNLSGITGGSIWAERNCGWEKADKMIRDGEVFSRIEGSDKEFKCYADSAKFCCVGSDFINLEESNNYVFADTWQDAVNLFTLR
jgi:hypothetical protein